MENGQIPQRPVTFSFSESMAITRGVGIQVPKPAGQSIQDFMNDWKNSYEAITGDAYKTNIVVVNADVKPVFLRAASIRKRRKIMVTRALKTKRNPRSRVFKNCYPIAVE